MHLKKIVLFGAGKIGRSFIGPLFNKAGYKVVFIDTDKKLIHELNRRGAYKLVIKSEAGEIKEEITNIKGIDASNREESAGEVATADIIGVSVGIKGISKVLPVIAEALLKRYKLNKDQPLDIIIAENLRNGAEYFRNNLLRLLPADYPAQKLIGLIETSIGKMVPIMLQKDLEEDSLQIFAEPYNTLILDKKGFKNPVPDVAGLAPKTNIKAWVDRKLFIHNLGHVSIAYTGFLYNKSMKYIWEALEIPNIYNYAKNTMNQSARLLLERYPRDFTPSDLEEHIDDLLNRFSNKALGDTIFRVGCDLERKLKADDRLAGAIKIAIESNLPYERILFALVCGCHFRAKDEAGNMLAEDARFVEQFNTNIARVMRNLSGFNNKEKYRTLIGDAEDINCKLSRLEFTHVLREFI